MFPHGVEGRREAALKSCLFSATSYRADDRVAIQNRHHTRSHDAEKPANRPKRAIRGLGVTGGDRYPVSKAQNGVATMNEQGTRAPRGGRDNPYSRPVFRQVLKVNSLQGQHVMARSFERVSNALFSIGVVLRVLCAPEEIDRVESVVMEDFSKTSTDLDRAIAQFTKLMEDNGVDAMPEYTHPNEYAIEIKSPQAARFAALIRKLDELMALVDTLWLNAVLNDKQRSDIGYQWRQRLVRLGGRIVAIERRAHAAARARGKDGEAAGESREEGREKEEEKDLGEEEKDPGAESAS